MPNMLCAFDDRRVRGRDRCPWIKVQVERANQIIKWIIDSMLITINTPSK